MPMSMLHYYPNVGGGGLKHTADLTFDMGGGVKPIMSPGSYAYENN